MTTDAETWRRAAEERASFGEVALTSLWRAAIVVCALVAFLVWLFRRPEP